MYRRGTSLERCMLGRKGDGLMTVSSGSREVWKRILRRLTQPYAALESVEIPVEPRPSPRPDLLFAAACIPPETGSNSCCRSSLSSKQVEQVARSWQSCPSY